MVVYGQSKALSVNLALCYSLKPTSFDKPAIYWKQLYQQYRLK